MLEIGSVSFLSILGIKQESGLNHEKEMFSTTNDVYSFIIGNKRMQKYSI